MSAAVDALKERQVALLNEDRAYAAKLIAEALRLEQRAREHRANAELIEQRVKAQASAYNLKLD